MDLNIRKFPDEVAKEAKIQAIDLGLKLQEWVVAAVRFALTNETRFRDFAKEAQNGVPQKASLSRLSRTRVGEASVSGARRTPSNPQPESGAVGRSVQEDAGREGKSKGSKGKLTPDQFFALSNSDQMRATREGRYP